MFCVMLTTQFYTRIIYLHCKDDTDDIHNKLPSYKFEDCCVGRLHISSTSSWNKEWTFLSVRVLFRSFLLTFVFSSSLQTIELPQKYPKIFARAPLRLRSNILFYGPTGCGKTHIVRAAAAACSLRFIPIMGPELLNMYIGSTEQYVRNHYFWTKWFIIPFILPFLVFLDRWKVYLP